MFDEIKKLVLTALNNFIENESYLLLNNVHEGTIAAQFAKYLSNESNRIPNFRWDIDCEYNKNIDLPKELFINGSHVIVRPDIIIHVRGQNNNNYNTDNNLLVVEIKKKATASDREHDFLKINGFIEQPPYYYKYGLFINFVDVHYEISWFLRNG
ncbi:MAG: hypothetical protein WCZ90_15690 [Melioribacteraceae bacterium]